MFTPIDLKSARKKIQVIRKYHFTINSYHERRETEAVIKQIIKRYQIPFVYHEYVRALGNAVYHGEYPIKCRVYIGSKHQMICTVEDAGAGFDYKEVIRKFENHQVYFHHKGFGTRCHARNPHLGVDWDKEGRKIILYYGGGRTYGSPMTPSL